MLTTGVDVSFWPFGSRSAEYKLSHCARTTSLQHVEVHAAYTSTRLKKLFFCSYSAAGGYNHL